MNWFDFVLLFILTLFVISGISNGLLKRLVEITGLLAAWFIALKWGGDFAVWLDGYLSFSSLVYSWVPAGVPGSSALPDLIRGLIGFVAVFFLVRIAFSILAQGLRQANNIPLLGKVNVLLGGLLGLVEGLLFLLLLVVLISFIPIDFLNRAADNSALVAIGRAYVPVVWRLVEGYFVDFFNGMV